MVSLSAQESNLSVWKGLCCSERALLWSTVEVGQLSAQAGNLSVWEGLYCSDGPLISLCRPLSGPKMLFRRSGKDSCCIEGALCLPVRRPERALREPGRLFIDMRGHFVGLRGPFVSLKGSAFGLRKSYWPERPCAGLRGPSDGLRSEWPSFLEDPRLA